MAARPDRIPLNIIGDPCRALLALGGEPSILPDWPPAGRVLIVVREPSDHPAQLILGRTDAAIPAIVPDAKDLYFSVPEDVFLAAHPEVAVLLP